MPLRDLEWKKWGKRFRFMARENGFNLARVASELGRAESTVRSWTNGSREINLSEFFALCVAGGVDPMQCLFGRAYLNAEQKAQLGEIVAKVLEADPSSSPGYGTMTRSLNIDLARRRKKP